MSDVEENFSFESVCFGWKLFYCNVFVVVRKKLLYNFEDEQSLKFEIEEEELKDEN